MWWLYIPLALYLAIVIGWVLYLAIMHLAPKRQTMHWFVKQHAYVLLGIALVYDFLILNMLIGSLLFWELPQRPANADGERRFEWLLTARLQRHHKTPGTRRAAIAAWICINMLNPFDPKGGHC
jgi:hypothetical protein